MNLGGPLTTVPLAVQERPLWVKGPPSAHHPSAKPHNPIEVDLMGGGWGGLR
jgi:hypothetical protein